MAVIDTSILIAVLESENDARRLLFGLMQADRRLISTASVLEAVRVLAKRRGAAAVDQIRIFLHVLNFEIIPFDLDQLPHAINGSIAFGKGMKSRARLNFGDCFVYGLAKAKSEPLLFKGNDFSQTDLQPA